MSKVEVNQISSQCGSTLTIGQSGDTVQLASGATQTGFGRTGTVNWDTTAKTAAFTAVSGNGYFVNTTSGAITVTLPASPSAGDIVSIKDYAGTATTNNITVARNGSNIEGSTSNMVIDTNSISVTIVYVDATQGWVQVSDNSAVYVPKYITATGGTVTTSGDYKIHTFTGPGTFCVSCGGNPLGSNSVDYLVVAGGGGGGADIAGGGGAGGMRFTASTYCAPTPSSPRAGLALPITATGYPITVGSGGAGGPLGLPLSPGPSQQGSSGSNSAFSTITSTGGGGGGSGDATKTAGLPGGSGGGGGGYQCVGVGSGNTPPVIPSQGNDGGAGEGNSGPTSSAGGGGGAGAAGQAGTSTGGDGGDGLQINISGSDTYYAGGGGGGNYNAGSSQPACTQSSGGQGGGGAGGIEGNVSPEIGGPVAAQAGTANTGGGGGGSGNSGPTVPGNPATRDGKSGGSGIVIIRYKYQ